MAGENAAQQAARAQAEKTGTNTDLDWPRDAFGTPMVKISCAAAELVATRQYSNVTVGPISVTRFVTDGDDEHLTAEVSRTQQLAERAVADDRRTVHDLIRGSAEATRSS